MTSKISRIVQVRSAKTVYDAMTLARKRIIILSMKQSREAK
jgi:hypothetical protein